MQHRRSTGEATPTARVEVRPAIPWIPPPAGKQVSSVYSGPRRQPFPEPEVVRAPVEIFHSVGIPGVVLF